MRSFELYRPLTCERRASILFARATCLDRDNVLYGSGKRRLCLPILPIIGRARNACNRRLLFSVFRGQPLVWERVWRRGGGAVPTRNKPITALRRQLRAIIVRNRSRALKVWFSRHLLRGCAATKTASSLLRVPYKSLARAVCSQTDADGQKLFFLYALVARQTVMHQQTPKGNKRRHEDDTATE